MNVQQMVADMKSSGDLDAKPRRGASKDASDPLSEFDRTIVGKSVRLEVPLKDISDLKRHMLLLIGVAERICMDIDRSGAKDRTILLNTKAELKILNRKLNAFRGGRKL
jgi:hypothetical protein